MAYVSVDEYRAQLYRDVTLPSGFTIKIGKVQAWDFVDLGELPIPQGMDGESDQGKAYESLGADDRSRLQRIKPYTDRAIAVGAIVPRMSDRPEDQDNPHILHVSELSRDDYQTLVSAIMQFSGLTQEDGQAIESFRTDAERTPDPGISGDLSFTTV